MLRYIRGGSKDSNLDPYDQVVKAGEGLVDLESVMLIIAGVPNKLECYIILGWKALTGTNTLTH
jgi:hypothetical protein